MDQMRYSSGRTPQCLLRPKIRNHNRNCRADPCERIRQTRAEEAEGRAEEERRARAHNELHRARNGRNDALPESLQNVAIDEQECEDDVARSVDDEVGMPVGDDLRRTVRERMCRTR